MHRRHGFTLIELLIVMVIVGILAAIATSFFWDAKDRALLSTMQNDLRTLAALQEEYYPSEMSYSDSFEALGFNSSQGVAINITYAENNGWAAQATHGSYDGECGVFIGDAPAANGAPATEQGVIACD